LIFDLSLYSWSLKLKGGADEVRRGAIRSVGLAGDRIKRTEVGAIGDGRVLTI